MHTTAAQAVSTTVIYQAVVVVPSILTQQSSTVFLGVISYCLVGRSRINPIHFVRGGRGYTNDLSRCYCGTKNSHTASSTFLVVVSYCWVGRSRINLMCVSGEVRRERISDLPNKCIGLRGVE
jgi:hypothetical protein